LPPTYRDRASGAEKHLLFATVFQLAVIVVGVMVGLKVADRLGAKRFIVHALIAVIVF